MPEMSFDYSAKHDSLALGFSGVGLGLRVLQLTGVGS